MSKQLTLFGTSAKDNKRAGNLIYKDPKSKYEKFIERFFVFSFFSFFPRILFHEAVNGFSKKNADVQRMY